VSSIATAHRRLTALILVRNDPELTQRRLARAVGISLGLANALLRRLEAERLIKVERLPAGARYRLTPAGRAALLRQAAALAKGALRALGGLTSVERGQLRRRLGPRGALVAALPPRREADHA